MTQSTDDQPKVQRNEECFAFFESLGSPKYGVAPMVDGSELPFRMLCRKYGATMAWTPMLHSRLFLEQKKFRKKVFTTCPEDRPLAVQFCANDPDILVAAAKLVEDECDAIDINLGCPQHIAKRGNYGAFLGDQWDIVKSLIEACAKNLKIPVFCKIRLLDTHEKTLEYARMIEAAGCSLLTVHGRTKEQKGHNQGLANLEWIRDIKNALSIPVLSNGNIRCLAEAEEALKITGCDGVMSACGLLVNPALFSGLDIPPCQLAEEYLEFGKQYPVEFHLIRGHLFKLLNNLFRVHVDLREALNKAKGIEDCEVLVKELKNRVNNSEDTEKEIQDAIVKQKEKKAMEAGGNADTTLGTNIDKLF